MIRPRREAGFALLDALVALAIFGVMLGLFVQTVQSTALAGSHAADSHRAALLAQSRLAVAVESGFLPLSGQDGDLSWRASAAPYPGAPGGRGLELVSVEVVAVGSARPLVTLTTLRLAR